MTAPRPEDPSCDCPDDNAREEIEPCRNRSLGKMAAQFSRDRGAAQPGRRPRFVGRSCRLWYRQCCGENIDDAVGGYGDCQVVLSRCRGKRRSHGIAAGPFRVGLRLQQPRRRIYLDLRACDGFIGAKRVEINDDVVSTSDDDKLEVAGRRVGTRCFRTRRRRCAMIVPLVCTRRHRRRQC